MIDPCVDCPKKVIDEYGWLCDLACGERTAWLNYTAGIKEVVEWFEQNINYKNSSIKEWDKWQSKLKEWGINE